MKKLKGEKKKKTLMQSIIVADVVIMELVSYTKTCRLNFERADAVRYKGFFYTL
jgi:hypothetical protein